MENIILVTFDSLRADHTGHGGYERNTTPTLDEMAKEGTIFEKALSPASRTNPSMAGILTGEPMVFQDKVSDPGIAGKHLDRFGTIAEKLSDKGYTTGAFCPNAYASRYYGFDSGFDYFEDFLFSNDIYQNLFSEHLSDSSLYTTIRNVRNFVRREEAFKTWDTYIEDVENWVRHTEEPFFLWIFSMDTHFPYLTPRTHREWSSLFDQYYYNWRCNKLIDQFDVDISERERQKIVDIYDDSIKFGDHLLKELQSRLSEFEPTYFIHGDHGESFDERGLYGHFYPALYQENVHVPFVVSGPHVDDRTVTDPMSLLDLPSLVMNIAEGQDLDISESDVAISTDFDGRNERNLIATRAGDKKLLLEESPSGTSIEIYDLAVDPGESDNLVHSDRSFKRLWSLTTSHLRTEIERIEIESTVSDLEDI